MEISMEENRQFRILSALGIIFVVAGHLGYHFLDVGGLFPYYSFHVYIFLFVSGYFYREQSEDDIFRYIYRKCITLMVPYFLWNLFYGILARLLHRAEFSLGESLSFKTLFLSPFIDGHQFLYNFSAWFIPALFLVEVINVVMRKVLGVLRLKNEWLILAGCLILNSVFCAGLAFGVVWVGSFANGPVVPYLTVMTGKCFFMILDMYIWPEVRKGANGFICWQE